MFNTLKISNKLHNAYRVNGIIYSLMQTPLVNKFLPVELYKSYALKVFASIIGYIGDFIATFFGKALYAFLMLYIASTYINENNAQNFIHIFVFTTIIGTMFNTCFFNPSKDKFYAIELMKIDAKKYVLANYFWFLSKTFVGMFPALLIFGIMAKVNIILCITMPFFIITTKVIYTAIMLQNSYKNGRTFNENIPTTFKMILLGLMIACGYGLPFLGITIGYTVYLILLLFSAIGSIPAFLFLFRFNEYKKFTKRLLSVDNIIFDINKFAKQSAIDASQKNIDTSVINVNGKTGYAYFHDIFVKRHRKILTKIINKIVIIYIVAVILGIIAVLLNKDVAKGLNEMILTFLPYFFFVMYISNRGAVVARAMFMNCDHSMLSYSFYRQPKSILTLFKKRLITNIKLNLLPASVIAIGLPLLLLLSGGTTNSINYIVLFLSIISMSVLFSVHHLAMYYLLQPYNVELESKSNMYNIVNSITYTVVFFMIYLRLDILLFGIFIILFTIIYTITMLILTYYFAPKTFKLR